MLGRAATALLVVAAVALWIACGGPANARPVDVLHDRLNCGHRGVHCPGGDDCVRTICMPAATATP